MMSPSGGPFPLPSTDSTGAQRPATRGRAPSRLLGSGESSYQTTSFCHGERPPTFHPFHFFILPK